MQNKKKIRRNQNLKRNLTKRKKRRKKKEEDEDEDDEDEDGSQIDFSQLDRIFLLFRFGMSGQFTFQKKSELPKHAHLNFSTKDNDQILSYVDPRRFGTWHVCTDYNRITRGPDPVLEYEAFRGNILENLTQKVFDKPICEVLLDQRYFNGIGNYLRAEILFRAGVPPFVAARGVLEGLPQKERSDEKEDFLFLCHQIPKEVVTLGGLGYLPGKTKDYQRFVEWLQCYQKSSRNLIDHNKRTIWFEGEPGPLAPKKKESRTKVHKFKKSASTGNLLVQKKKITKTDTNGDTIVKSKTKKVKIISKESDKKLNEVKVLEIY